jgi:hypothetical protein
MAKQSGAIAGTCREGRVRSIGRKQARMMPVVEGKESTMNNEKIEEIVGKIKSLKAFQHDTGMSCKRSIGELMARLTADELVAVSEKLYGKQ